MLQINPILEHAQCEHAMLFCHDASATPDDLMLMPNAFLETLENCQNDAVAQVIISDEWNELMNAEPDEYFYCQEHLEQFIDSQTAPE
jgi:hypothetical protein